MSDFLSFLAGVVILYVFWKMVFGRKARRSSSGGFNSMSSNDPFEDKGSYSLDDDTDAGDSGDDSGDSGGSDD